MTDRYDSHYKGFVTEPIIIMEEWIGEMGLLGREAGEESLKLFLLLFKENRVELFCKRNIIYKKHDYTFVAGNNYLFAKSTENNWCFTITDTTKVFLETKDIIENFTTVPESEEV